MVAPLIRTFPPVYVGISKLKNAEVGLKVKVTVFKHAGVKLVVKAKSQGCVSIPTYNMLEAGGTKEKVRVWTTQVMVIVKVLLIEGMLG